jgi:hypothetical protein
MDEMDEDHTDGAPTSLTDLPDDALACLLCACSASALCRLARTSSALSAAAAAEEPWRACLRRDFGVPLRLATKARAAYHDLATSPAPRDLTVCGFLTDGGLDGLDETGEMGGRQLPEGACSVNVASEQARTCWVHNAFDTECEDVSCFCSDIGSTGGPASNVLIAGRITGTLSADGASARAAAAERREFVCARLARVAGPLWGIDDAAEGFGGLRAMSIQQLEHCLAAAWQASCPPRPLHAPLLRRRARRAAAPAHRPSARRETARRTPHAPSPAHSVSACGFASVRACRPTSARSLWTT